MHKKDVPQHGGFLGPWREATYAVDDQGRYGLAGSSGWEPKNIALQQAWEVIDAELRQMARQVAAGRFSPLAYHMARCQMDVALLAKYTGLSRWRVRRHLKPAVFARLDAAMLARYAALFGISRAQLCEVPTEPELPVPLPTEEGAVDRAD